MLPVVLAQKAKTIPAIPDASNVFSSNLAVTKNREAAETVPTIYFSGLTRDSIRDVIRAMRLGGFGIYTYIL